MSDYFCRNRKELAETVKSLAEGDCVQVESFSHVADSATELLSALVNIAGRGADFVCLCEGVDTRGEQGPFFFSVCQALYGLDRRSELEKRQAAIERAKEEGRYKGRKPIPVDENIFEAVVSSWESGAITARQAMAQLDLKPNTFYRRIKEREELKMKDYKKVQHEIRSEIKEAARQSRRDLDELKQQVKAEAKEIKKAADEKLDLHDVEKEIRKDRIRAEIEHSDTVKQMKKDVEAETKELKKMMEEATSEAEA